MKTVPAEIEPGMAEFIAREFAQDLSSDADARRLKEIYHALFVEGKTIETVRAELCGTGPEQASEWMQPAELLSIDLRFGCANCGQRMQVDGRSEGTMIECPRCAGSMAVPRLARALQLLSAAATVETERALFQQMERGLMAVLGPAPETLATERRERGTTSILSIEMRLRCVSCGKSAQLDARFHGTSVPCPACAEAMDVPAWCASLVALHQTEFAVRPLRALAPLTAQEREFLSAPRSTPKKWWSGLTGPFRGGRDE